jgi:hypothetical protein
MTSMRLERTLLRGGEYGIAVPNFMGSLRR